MTVRNLSREFPLRFEIIPASLSRAVSETRLETTAMSCVAGMIGSGMVLLAVIFALTAGAGAYAMLMSWATGRALVMQLGPVLWGLAFLAVHIGLLRRVTDPVWRSPFGLLVFAGLAFCVSLLFTTLTLTVSGLGLVAVVMAHMMATGFSLTAIGLVLWTVWQRSRNSSRALTGV